MSLKGPKITAVKLKGPATTTAIKGPKVTVRKLSGPG